MLDLSACKMTTFSDGNHGLNLSPHHQFLLWGKQLVAPDFAEKCTQRAHHQKTGNELNLEPKCFHSVGVIKTAEFIFYA